MAYNFVANYKNLGEQYILSAKVHLDESTPHLHIVFMPIIHTKDKNGNKIDKLACSEYWKGKDIYKQLQDNFYKYITKNGFDLDLALTQDDIDLQNKKVRVHRTLTTDENNAVIMGETTKTEAGIT